MDLPFAPVPPTITMLTGGLIEILNGVAETLCAEIPEIFSGLDCSRSNRTRGQNVSNAEFRSFLNEEVKRIGGRRVLVARLRERYRDLSPGQAQKQVARALKGPVGPEIRRNLLSVLDLPSSRRRELLELAEDDPAAPEPEVSRAFQIHAEAELVEGGRLFAGDGCGETFVGACRLLVQLCNRGDRPITITGLELRAEWSPVRLNRIPRLPAATGAAVVPHRATVELRRDGFSGDWVLADGPRVVADPRPFAAEWPRGDLLRAPEGHRTLFEIGAVSCDWVQLTLVPRDPGLCSVELWAMATSVDADRAFRRTSPIRVTRWEDADGP